MSSCDITITNTGTLSHDQAYLGNVVSIYTLLYILKDIVNLKIEGHTYLQSHIYAKYLNFESLQFFIKYLKCDPLLRLKTILQINGKSMTPQFLNTVTPNTTSNSNRTRKRKRFKDKFSSLNNDLSPGLSAQKRRSSTSEVTRLSEGSFLDFTTSPDIVDGKLHKFEGAESCLHLRVCA